MHRSHVAQLLFELHLSQLRLSQFSKISTSRISRFLGGTLDLKPEESSRLLRVLTVCRLIQNGAEHLAESHPVDWNKSAEAVKAKIAEDPETVYAGWTEFQADVEFFEGEDVSALTIAVPFAVLTECMKSANKFIKINRNEILNLFSLKLENPNTPACDRQKITELLALVPSEGK